jgi:hypothetical protein
MPLVPFAPLVPGAPWAPFWPAAPAGPVSPAGPFTAQVTRRSPLRHFLASRKAPLFFAQALIVFGAALPDCAMA